MLSNDLHFLPLSPLIPGDVLCFVILLCCFELCWYYVAMLNAVFKLLAFGFRLMSSFSLVSSWLQICADIYQWQLKQVSNDQLTDPVVGQLTYLCPLTFKGNFWIVQSWPRIHGQGDGFGLCSKWFCVKNPLFTKAIHVRVSATYSGWSVSCWVGPSFKLLGIGGTVSTSQIFQTKSLGVLRANNNVTSYCLYAAMFLGNCWMH